MTDNSVPMPLKAPEADPDCEHEPVGRTLTVLATCKDCGGRIRLVSMDDEPPDCLEDMLEDVYFWEHD